MGAAVIKEGRASGGSQDHAGKRRRETGNRRGLGKGSADSSLSVPLELQILKTSCHGAFPPGHPTGGEQGDSQGAR